MHRMCSWNRGVQCLCTNNGHESVFKIRYLILVGHAGEGSTQTQWDVWEGCEANQSVELRSNKREVGVVSAEW